MADKSPEYLQPQKQDDGGGLPGSRLLMAAGAYGLARTFAPNLTRAVQRGVIRVAGVGLETGRSAFSYASQAWRLGDRMRLAGNFVRSMDHAVENRSIFSLMTEQRGRFDQRFDQSFRRGLQGINRAKMTPLKGMSTQIEEQFNNLTKTLSGLAPKMQFSAFRYNAAINELKRKMPQHFETPGLEAILSGQQEEFFNDPSKGKIAGLLHNYTRANAKKAGKQFHISIPHGDHQKFIDSMFDTLQTYSKRENVDRHMLRNGNPSYDGMKVQGMRKLRGRLMDDFMESRKWKRQGFIQTVMDAMGYRQAQMRDMLHHDESANKWVNKLFDADSIRDHHHNSGQAYNKNMGRRLAAMANSSKYGEQFLDLTVDDHLFINAAGELRDLRGAAKGLYNSASYFQQNFKVPFLNFNPLDLMHFSTYEAVRSAPKTYFLRRGTIHPFLGDSVETTAHPLAHNQDAAAMPLARDYMYSNGNVYDVLSGDLVKSDVFLSSGRFGMVPRMAASMANLHRVDYTKRGILGKIFDIGAQEGEHFLGRFTSQFTKFSDEDWAPNTFRLMFNPEKNTEAEYREKAYRKIYSVMHSNSQVLSDRTVDYLGETARTAYGHTGIDITNMHTNEDVRSVLGQLYKGLNESSSGVYRQNKGLNEQITTAWEQWFNNPSEFVKNTRVYNPHSMELPSTIQGMESKETRLIGKTEDVVRLIHQHAISQIESRTGRSIGHIVRDGVKSGDLLDNAFDEVRDLSVLTKLQDHWEDVYRHGPEEKFNAIADFFHDTGASPLGGTPTVFGKNLYASLEKHSPKFATGPGSEPPQYQGFINYTVMNKARGHRAWIEGYNKQVQEGKDPFDALLKSTWGVLGQPFAGRKNLGDVTTATMPFYYMFERMDNALSKVGLGLSQQSRGSAQSIFLNQFGRRVVLPFMAYKELQNLDDSTNNVTSDALSSGYVNASIGMARAKDLLGINAIFKGMGNLIPGSDQLWQTPLFSAVKHATFGLVGETRSGDELQDYYQNGDDPVRHGRWWGVGSNTPWEGGKIDYFQPNWYRRMQSHYKYTDTMYGSESEYWANNWVPTLTHPLAPLRHFVTDPDHYANKHRDDRPYPIYGGVDELNMIPIAGPAINHLIYGQKERGGLKKAHREYLKDINEYYQAQYKASTQGGYLETLPAGGVKLMSEGGGFGGGFGEGMSSFITPEGLGTPGVAGAGLDSSSPVAGLGGGGIVDMTSMSKSELTAINLGFTKGMGISPSRSIDSLEKMRDPDVLADLKDYDQPYGVSGLTGAAGYSLTELAGIYGFGVRMAAGDPKYGPTLDKASRMTSYSRAWWDMEFGGADGIFGGEFSEIFRRYNPRDQRKSYYNPFKNKMPDWMPGVNYFTDFQHGDPYAKVQKGEMRLPGASYEKLHQLHPDAFGDYGAFDRFKILGDVAPYSDEYKFWRRVVSQMNSSGMLDDGMKAEYAKVRDQVSQKKDKYHLYPYQFSDAKVDKHEVTVTQVIDANTFLTDYDPLHPIRLAGVHVPVNAEAAQEWLSRFIHPGSKITIGVDSDPINRVRDDTLQTIRAVVYANGNDDTPWYNSVKGQSLNAILSKRDFGDKDKVTTKADGTAVTTAALFDKQQITVGKLMEWTMHTALPNIPVVGVFADKFLQVRSPLEMYKRNQVYGKDWRPWTEPWKGWIQPMLQTMASHNPLLAAAQGYGIGKLFGKLKGGQHIGKYAGMLTAGLMASVRTLDQFMGDHMPGGQHYAPIPERRKKEREINEYFDTLKYMKYKGLYERANAEAIAHEGVDLNKFLDDSKVHGDRNKKTKKYIATVKKWLSITEKLGYVDQDLIDEKLAQANQRMNQIGEDKALTSIGPYAMQAMQYRSEYESTLYGADPNGDMTMIYKSLPKKDREFFQSFLTAKPAEREEILRLVPANERRFFEAKWGMDVEKQQGLTSYFASHYLPNAQWEGWRSDISLDAVKLKVAKQEGIDATEFGMWPDDETRADQMNVSAISPFRPSMSIDPNRIEKVLRGAGLRDATVTMTKGPSQDHQVNVTMDFVKDRSKDILQGINEHIGQLI